MRTSTKDSNIEHEKALKVVADFKKAGGKVRVYGVTKSAKSKTIENKKQAALSKLRECKGAKNVK